MKLLAKIISLTLLLSPLSALPAWAGEYDTCRDFQAANNGNAPFLAFATDHNPKFFDNLGDEVEVLNTDGTTATVRVPVTFFDRNTDQGFQADEFEVVVPGARREGMLKICVASPVEKATVRAEIVNAITGGKVTDMADPFYTDLKVAGVPFASLVDKETTVLEPTTVSAGEVVDLPLVYELAFDSPAGNRAGTDAKDPTTGEPNTYEQGSRVAALDIRVSVEGDFPEKPVLARTGITRAALVVAGVLMILGVAVLSTGIGLQTNREEEMHAGD